MHYSWWYTCWFAKHIELICEWWHDDVQCSKAKSEAQMYKANLLLKCEVETDDQITAKADAQMAEAEAEAWMNRAKTGDQMDDAETEAWWLWQN